MKGRMYEVALGDGRTAEVLVERKRMKTMRLRARRDGTVRGSVPTWAGEAEIRAFLEGNAGWIARQIDRVEARAAEGVVPAEGSEAGTLPLWGELVDAAEALAAVAPGRFGDHPAAVREDRAGSGAAIALPCLDGAVPPAGEAASPISNLAHVFGDADGDAPHDRRTAPRSAGIAHLAPDELAARIDLLYKREVECALPALAARYEAALGASATRWTVRAMTSRWGSCTPATGAIRINSRLAAYPPACLGSVVAHELVHLRVRGHRADFHRLLDEICPGNRDAGRILRLTPREAARRGH